MANYVWWGVGTEGLNNCTAKTCKILFTLLIGHRRGNLDHATDWGWSPCCDSSQPARARPTESAGNEDTDLSHYTVYAGKWILHATITRTIKSLVAEKIEIFSPFWRAGGAFNIISTEFAGTSCRNIISKQPSFSFLQFPIKRIFCLNWTDENF